MDKGRHRAGRLGRGTIVLLVVTAILGLGTAGTAFAAMRYDRSHADRILPGVRIGGLAVGGMTHDQAIRAVTASVQGRLARTISITAGAHSWSKSLSDLGMSADVPAAVDQAFALADSYSWMSRVYHRISNKPVERSLDVAYRLDASAVTSWVGRAAKVVAVAPRDASFDLVDGRVVMTHSRSGRVLKPLLSASLLRDAVTAVKPIVRLPMSTAHPKVADGDIGRTIVVSETTNTLRLYDGFKVLRQYRVATAREGFITPPGDWEIVNKVENPTWYNPAPDGWGKDEPLIIPPGPGNPLGTRALYLNAPGIRIHGTPDDSSIGTWASHGCIRMHISESEALYPLVPIGTKVLIVGSPPWGFPAASAGPAG